jgi:hypothetical protein
MLLARTRVPHPRFEAVKKTVRQVFFIERRGVRGVFVLLGFFEALPGWPYRLALLVILK